ncbi:MAG TPA: AEC family transporter [Acidimicrobiia bacterium]|nr:AEC family transporter [Acidimicrobiia bacterium]
MSDTLVALSPIFVGLSLGVILRRVGVAGLTEASTLLKIIFYVISPAVSFSATSDVEITKHLLLFPVFAFISVVAGYFTGKFFASRINIDGVKKTVFVLACLIVNSFVSLAFLSAQYGTDGAARAILFDFVNAPMIYGVAYAIAVKGNPSVHLQTSVIKKVLLGPPIWGIVLGILVNIMDIDVPKVVDQTVKTFSLPFVPILMIAIGLSIVIKKKDVMPSFIAAGVRLVTGITIATAFVLLLDLNGIDRAAVLTLGVAPVGFNTVTFASLENLDVEFAAETLSVSVLIGVVASSAVILLTT